MLSCQIVLLLSNHSLWNSCNCQVEKAYFRHYSNLYICKHSYCTGCYDRTHIRQQKMSDHVKTLHEASGWVWHWPLTSLKAIWGLGPGENGPGGKGVIFMLCWKASLSLSLTLHLMHAFRQETQQEWWYTGDRGEFCSSVTLWGFSVLCVSNLKKKYSYIWGISHPLP